MAKTFMDENVYVLGPLELSPGHFAVGAVSYAAIKGNYPHYNAMREQFYIDGNKAAGDAIGELETRAVKAEEQYTRMRALHKADTARIATLTETVEKLKGEIDKLTEKKAKTTRKSKITMIDDVSVEESDDEYRADVAAD